MKPNKLNYESDVQNIVVKLTAIDKQGDMSVQTMIVKVCVKFECVYYNRNKESINYIIINYLNSNSN